MHITETTQLRQDMKKRNNYFTFIYDMFINTSYVNSVLLLQVLRIPTLVQEQTQIYEQNYIQS